MNRRSKVCLGAAAIILGAQLVPIDANPPALRHGSAVTEPALPAPPAVWASLNRSCFDCHSDHPQWPWYARVAPLSWWVRRDIEEGRRRLNFSEWSEYASDPGSAAQKLDEIAKLTQNGAMPPWYYGLVHREAILTSAERSAIASWVAESKARLPSDTIDTGKGR